MVTMMGCVTKLCWGQQPQRKLSPNAHHFFVFFFKADGSFSGFACSFFVFLDKGSKKKAGFKQWLRGRSVSGWSAGAPEGAQAADGQCASSKYFYISSVKNSNDTCSHLAYVLFQPSLPAVPVHPPPLSPSSPFLLPLVWPR